jgi:hypothetical protein
MPGVFMPFAGLQSFALAHTMIASPRRYPNSAADTIIDESFVAAGSSRSYLPCP